MKRNLTLMVKHAKLCSIMFFLFGNVWGQRTLPRAHVRLAIDSYCTCERMLANSNRWTWDVSQQNMVKPGFVSHLADLKNKMHMTPVGAAHAKHLGLSSSSPVGLKPTESQAKTRPSNLCPISDAPRRSSTVTSLYTQGQRLIERHSNSNGLRRRMGS